MQKIFINKSVGEKDVQYRQRIIDKRFADSTI